jgi:hypothetical protein
VSSAQVIIEVEALSLSEVVSCAVSHILKRLHIFKKNKAGKVKFLVCLNTTP